LPVFFSAGARRESTEFGPELVPNPEAIFPGLRAGTVIGELAASGFRTIKDKQARHCIGWPNFLKPSRSMVRIGG
jgi:hypothetical protein